MLASFIHNNARNFSNKDAVIFLQQGMENQRLTFADLDKKAGALAANLHKSHLTKAKIILLYPTGLHFVIAYVACLYAGAIPICLTPPDRNQLTRTSLHIDSVLNDSKANVVLTDAATHAVIREHGLLKQIENIIVTDTTPEHQDTDFFLNDAVKADDIAHIQYSSGTTGAAKGIMLTHANLLHSLHANTNYWKLSEHHKSLTWTPHYYIYGLLTGILLPLYHAATNHILSSIDVINHPTVWLNALSQYEIHYSGCPNFGYQLCVDKVDPASLATIDLSRWKIAICGGDFIQAKTLRKFYETVKSCGFEREHFCASYGMSEMTGFVSATHIGRNPSFYPLNKSSLRANKVVKDEDELNAYTVVSCGEITKGTKVKIIHQDALNEVAMNEIGEICLSGPTLCQAYLNREFSVDESLFFTGERYFRTGDLGFLHQNELYLVGRIKEMIIINGKNYTSIDLELSVKQAHPTLNNTVIAAVPMNIGRDENVMVMAEIDHHLTEAQCIEMTNAVRQATLKYSGLLVHHIVLVKLGCLPKTNGGKLQRNAAKQAYLLQQLDIIYENHIDENQEINNAKQNLVEQFSKVEQAERRMMIEQNLHQIMRDILNIDIANMSDVRFFDLGMTSLLAVEFKDRIQTLVENQIYLSPSFIFEYPSIATMATYIEEQLALKIVNER